MADKCKLYCRVINTTSHFTVQEKVIDGTPCSFSGFDKCVNGICRQAGCDNELNSNAMLGEFLVSIDIQHIQRKITLKIFIGCQFAAFYSSKV